MSPNQRSQKLIGFVLYPGFTLLEMVGTCHLLMASVNLKGYRLMFVSEQTGLVESDTPLPVLAQKTFADLPEPVGLIVPGSSRMQMETLENSQLVEYVRKAGASAQWIAGVSSGALILGTAGLLQGHKATSHWSYSDRLVEYGAEYVRQSFVEDGKIFTSAGVSGGIDMAIYLGAKLAGKTLANFAQTIAEYDPKPPFGGIDWENFDGKAYPAAALKHVVNSQRTTIALMIYPGLTVLDLVGPLQVYSTLARFDPRFDVYVVSEGKEPVLVDLGISMVPNRTFSELPNPDILVIPGGDTPALHAMSNQPIRDYIHTVHQKAQVVASVCTGALILASTGLLKGRKATTHWAYYKILEEYGASYQRQRWVEDGKFFMSAGVSAGIDASLALISHLAGEEIARKVQLALHYDPHPPLGSIDWDHLSPMLRAIRLVNSLRAPFVTSKPKKLTRRAAW